MTYRATNEIVCQNNLVSDSRTEIPAQNYSNGRKQLKSDCDVQFSVLEIPATLI